jgi:hypothetical protein
MSSLPTLTLKFPNRIFMWYLENYQTHVPFPRHHQFYLLLGHECSEQLWHQRPLSIMYNILSLTISTLLTADMILICTRNLYLIHETCSPFLRKMCILLQVHCQRPPIWPLAFLLNLTYISTVPSKLIKEPALYKLLTFHNPNLISIFCRLSKESIQVWGSVWFFVTNFFFIVKCL